MKPLVFVLAISSVIILAYSLTEKLVFYDDFNRLDHNIWKHAITMTGGGNWEFQQYVNNRTTSWTDKGILYLKPMTTLQYAGVDPATPGFSIDLWGNEAPDYCTSNFQYGCSRTTTSGFIVNPITSARVRTAESFSFKYGRVEIRAKLPRGDWIWPSLWLMPRYNQYGTWPASGEIDIAESRGNRNYLQHAAPEGGIESWSSTLHWGPYYGANGYPTTRKLKQLTGKDYADDFHVFGLYWDQDRLYTYLDTPSNINLDVDLKTKSFWQKANEAGLGWDQQKLANPWVNQPNRAPFNQEFFIILNTAVGGTGGYFSDNIPGKPWKNTATSAFNDFWAARSQWLPTWIGNDTALQVDWVKVYIFPEISTYTLNNASATGTPTPLLQSTGWWPYIIAIISAGVAILSGLLAVFALSIVLGFKVQQDKKKKAKKEARRIDQPMGGGAIELHTVEETRSNAAMAH